jgi:hypothetical protein
MLGILRGDRDRSPDNRRPESETLTRCNDRLTSVEPGCLSRGRLSSQPLGTGPAIKPLGIDNTFDEFRCEFAATCPSVSTNQSRAGEKRQFRGGCFDCQECAPLMSVSAALQLSANSQRAINR